MADQHATGDSTHGHDDHEQSHGIGIYVRVFVALLVLTIASFTVGSLEITMSRPAVGWSLMLAISCMKALLVISFFMHLLWEANWKYVLTIPASFMSIFLIVMLVPDVLDRISNYGEERQRHAAPAEEPHSRFHHEAEKHEFKLHDPAKSSEKAPPVAH